MTYGEPARPAARRARIAGLAVVVVVCGTVLGVAVSPVFTGGSGHVFSGGGAGEAATGGHRGHRPHERPGRAPAPRVGEADGTVPDGVTVFDDGYPAVANLDPDLRRALRAAAYDAEDDGIGFVVNSGWRSPDYQNQLLREAVAEYGSEEEAARWVATPETSLHVSGDAVDLGPPEAAAWLAEHGAANGLCRVYDNEPWHFELRPEAVEHGCPRGYADPTRDPRMHQ